MAELEKLGSKYKVALRIARDARFERLPCQHKGTYVQPPPTKPNTVSLQFARQNFTKSSELFAPQLR
jgi:hypothetical protein